MFNRSIAVLTLIIGCFLLLSCAEKSSKSDTEKQPQRTVQTQKQKLALGEQIYKGKGNCASCHLANKAAIGPSVKEILEVYDKHNADIVSFLKGESQPIVDPSKFVLMQPNLEITKKMTDNELSAIVSYMRTL
ncbi:c-type cytochrome [Myroides sp. LJL116]